MRLRALLCALLFAVLSCLIVFSNVFTSPLVASALSEGRYLTAQETLDLFGQTIEIQYYDGSGYTTTTASYQRQATCETNFSDYVHSGLSGLFYYFQASTNLNPPDYINIKLEPQWSIYDTFQLHTVLAVGTSVSGVSSAAYDAPFWTWHVGGARVKYEQYADNNGLFPVMQYNDGWIRSGLFVEVSHTSQTAFNASSIEAGFQGVLDYGTCIFVGCPYVSPDSSAATGTIPTTSAGSGSSTETTAIDINVNVDLDETNTILETIVSWLETVGEVIAGLFVPPASFYAQWKADLLALFARAFGGMDRFDSYFEDFIATLSSSSAVSTVHFPGLSVPLPGGDTAEIMQASDVSVIPSGMGSVTIMGTEYTFINFIKFMFDLVATIAFINTVRNKLRALIFGTTVVESDHEQG